MNKSIVSIVKTPQNPIYEHIFSAVERAVDLAGGIREYVKPGQRVLINPSWVTAVTRKEQAVITLPEVSRAVADIVKNAGARPIIAESSAIGIDSEKVIAESGYQKLRNMGYEVVDLKNTETVMIPVPNGKIFKEIQSFRPVQEADAIIPVAKLKTHDQMELTMSIKKLKGLLSDKYKREFHQQGVFQACVDWYEAISPRLCVVDAVYCQEGLGPIFGKPVEMDLIVAGSDGVAVDAVCGFIVGFDPEEVPITREAAARGLGVAKKEEIEVVGESIESVYRRFMRVLEDERIKIEGFNLVYGDATCTGCRMGIMSSLFDMKEADQLMYLPGVAVVTGDPEIPEAVAQQDLVTVGRCVPREKRSQRHVKGCPPNNLDIVQAIIGDRDRAERRWE
ncbi:MAG: DUF362 domain-containing protein [Deltaproteobacteria bacterium]|nr:DUF362 domain-containing protein [Deltaproteobacteria bacterium]MBW1961544.1 DUF362 domain-containing protein [Deltaproteobacteria bacterium]MBW2152232.1 DUF362 domain-containing protein [Deltaproteobacteria bacterium]